MRMKRLKAILSAFALAAAGAAGIVVIPYVCAWANAAAASYYYVLEDSDGQFALVKDDDGVLGEYYTIATPGNALYNQLIVPEGKEFCSWQVIKAEPDVRLLATSSNVSPPDATPSDATPSNATPSDVIPSEDDDIVTISTPSDVILEGPVVITEYPVYLKAGQRYLKDMLLSYANDRHQFAVQPVYHEKNISLFNIMPVGETPETASYELTFDRDAAVTGMLGGDNLIQLDTVNGKVSFSVLKPRSDQDNQLLISAYAICPYCDQIIELGSTCIIELPIYTRSNGDGGTSGSSDSERTEDAPDPEAGTVVLGMENTAANGLLQGQNGDILSIRYPAPNSNGWYSIMPQLVLEAAEGYQAYFQVSNTSMGQILEQSVTRLYTGQSFFDQDGVYQLKVWAQAEGADSKLSETLLEFKIDRTAPQISVSYDRNEASNLNYYSKARRATILIDEVNFSETNVAIQPQNGLNSGRWTHDGTKHSTTVLYDNEGLCSLDVTCTDLSGRVGRIEDAQVFTIDTTAPILRIEGVKHLTANKEPVAPVITYQDESLDHSRTIIRLESYSQGEIKGSRQQILESTAGTCKLASIKEDDNYILTVRIYDKAGNSTEEQVSFSINQFGATFVFLNKEVIGNYTNQSFYPAIEVWNVDEMTIVSATINGQDADYTYEDGVVRFNNPIDKDGKYVIGLEVKDSADNYSVMKPVEFYFDNTKPVNLIQGVENGGVYNSPVTIVIQTEQSGDMIRDIYLNGQKTEDYQIDKLGIVTMQINHPGSYILEVVSVDLAGNVSDTNPVSFSFVRKDDAAAVSGNNKLLFWLAVISAGAAAVFGLCVWRRKGKSRKAKPEKDV